MIHFIWKCVKTKSSRKYWSVASFLSVHQCISFWLVRSQFMRVCEHIWNISSMSQTHSQNGWTWLIIRHQFIREQSGKFSPYNPYNFLRRSLLIFVSLEKGRKGGVPPRKELKYSSLSLLFSLNTFGINVGSEEFLEIKILEPSPCFADASLSFILINILIIIIIIILKKRSGRSRN